MAGSDKEARRVDSGRDTDKSKNSISQAARGKTKRQLKEQDAEWGFEPGKSGMATEAKMGMGIIVILVCAFGFLVYHKFDLRQRQLLAASVNGQADDSTELQAAIEDQKDALSGFAGETKKPTAGSELLSDDLNPLVPAADLQSPLLAANEGERSFTASLPNEETTSFTRDSASEQPVGFSAGSESDADLFAGLGEPVESRNDSPPAFVASEMPSVEDEVDPFAALAMNSASNSSAAPEPQTPAFEPTVEPNLFGSTAPVDTGDEFPAFDQTQSVPVAANDASTGAFDEPPVAESSPAPSELPPAFDTLVANETPLATEQLADALPFAEPKTNVKDSPRSLEPAQSLPYADEVAAIAPTRSVSQSNQTSTDAPKTEPNLFGAAEPLPPVETFGQSPRLADNAGNAANRIDSLPTERKGRLDEVAELAPSKAPPRSDLHNVIAMLEPGPDVNLFEDPVAERTLPPTTFPADNEPSFPSVAEPAMPQFPAMDNGFQQNVPEPKLETFPSAEVNSSSTVTFDSPNLFQEPIATEPTPAPNNQQVFPVESDTQLEFAPVPQPIDPVPYDPATSGQVARRPYEPEPAANQTLQLGPEDGIARMIEPQNIQQTSATYRHKEICEVRNDDTYWTISKRIYGTPRYFSSLALYNKTRIPDPKKLRPGMKVLVPDPKILEAKYPEFFPVAKSAKRSQPAGYFLDSAGKPAYRVGQNETLGAISQKHLGRASRWIQIYQMNRQTLRDPNRLKPGTVINLPDDATNVQLRL